MHRVLLAMGSNSRGERLTIYFNQTDPLISQERGKKCLLMLLSIGSSDWVYNTDWIGSLVALTTYATIPLRIWLGFMLLFSSGLEKRSTEI